MGKGGFATLVGAVPELVQVLDKPGVEVGALSGRRVGQVSGLLKGVDGQKDPGLLALVVCHSLLWEVVELG